MPKALKIQALERVCIILSCLSQLDGFLCNMTYDYMNRLVSARNNIYTYNAENMRISNVCDMYETEYTYDPNGKLNKLIMKKTNGSVKKYVYGLGLIGEDDNGHFKTYHFDYRGSTVAITNENGAITDRFAYDTYGKQISHTGNSFIIFGYNGRDGVITDVNGLLYMRSRYYSPELRRFVNADVLHGNISSSPSLNRYAHVNANIDKRYSRVSNDLLLYLDNNATYNVECLTHGYNTTELEDEEGFVISKLKEFFKPDIGEYTGDCIHFDFSKNPRFNPVTSFFYAYELYEMGLPQNRTIEGIWLELVGHYLLHQIDILDLFENDNIADMGNYENDDNAEFWEKLIHGIMEGLENAYYDKY